MFAKYPKELVLKDKTKVTFRPLEIGDRKALYEFFNRLPEKDKLYLKDDVSNPNVINRWVSNMDFESIIPIVAVHDGQIVGDATLHMEKHGWSRHVGEIRLVIDEKFRRTGLGMHLAKEIFDLAISAKLEKVMAVMMNNQKAAIKIFETIGFVKEAELAGHVKDLHGKRHNLVIMVQDVQAIWKRMEDLIHDSYDDLSGTYFVQ